MITEQEFKKVKTQRNQWCFISFFWWIVAIFFIIKSNYNL